MEHPSAAPAATAEIEGVITKPSPRSVADTVVRITQLVEGKGMRVFAVIDQRQQAREHGLDLRETTLVVFGSPQAGTPVMEAAPLAALDLPLKLLVWAEGERTNVSYTAPDELARRYGLTGDLAERLAGIDALSDAVVTI
jgi:uncharacterized protein (DUF302 family)